MTENENMEYRMQIEMFFESACMDYTDKDTSGRYARARMILDQHPEIAQFDIYTSSIVGDIGTVKNLLKQDPSLARQKGAPRNWDPLLYLCYSQVNSQIEGHNTLEAAKILLQNGADPNTQFTYPYGSIFTTVTGALGEGERGPANQPEHQYGFELAKLLLDAGSNPNDGQALYNRMFKPENDVIHLFLSYGLKANDKVNWVENSEYGMLDFLLGYAVKQNSPQRVALLLEHGADPNSLDFYNKKSHYKNAVANGNAEIAELLIKYAPERAVEMT